MNALVISEGLDLSCLAYDSFLLHWHNVPIES